MIFTTDIYKIIPFTKVPNPKIKTLDQLPPSYLAPTVRARLTPLGGPDMIGSESGVLDIDANPKSTDVPCEIGLGPELTPLLPSSAHKSSSATRFAPNAEKLTLLSAHPPDSAEPEGKAEEETCLGIVCSGDKNPSDV